MSPPDSSPSRVRAVVLNFNGGDLVRRCVQSLLVSEWPDLEVVVVDNDSQDGSVAVIEREFPQVKVLRTGSNIGFPANNAAMGDRAGIAHIALINPDAEVEPGWLSPLVEAMEADPSLGAVCPKLLFADRFVDLEVRTGTFAGARGDDRPLGLRVHAALVQGVDVLAQLRGEGVWEVEYGAGGRYRWAAGTAAIGVPLPPEGEEITVQLTVSAERDKPATFRSGVTSVDFEVGPEPRTLEVTLAGEAYDLVNNAGSRLYRDGYCGDRGFRERDFGQFDQPAEVFAWCGGAVLLRSSYLDDVGLFDERFFLYYEDADLSWRGHARGWRYRSVPSSRVRHVHAASTVEGSELFAYYVERNRLAMLAKNAPAAFVLKALLRYVRVTASYGIRDVVRPVLGAHRPRPMMVRRRLRAMAGFVQLLPYLLRQRRAVNARRTRPAALALEWVEVPAR